MSDNDKICVTCVTDDSFRLVTEDYRPIITEDGKHYIDDTIIIYSLVKIDPPIPVWTDLYGNSVPQYGTVLIGGNGLNS